MSLLSIVRVSVGEVGVRPGTIKMLTTDNLSTITTAGYLNGIGGQLNTLDIAPSDIVECMYSYNSSTDAGLFAFLTVSISNGVITLTATAGVSTLTNGHIFVGNASNVPTDVAMSGDISITNTGVTAIVANAVTTTKILNSNVTLAKLAAGIAPAAVIKFAAQYTTTGGAAAEAITVTGAVAATDRAFVQVVSQGSNTVTVLKAVVTTNTLTVTFSGDPGADAIINYQLIRAAS